MITFSNVSLSVNGITILSDASFQMREGEFVFLVGATGSGKSLFLRLISMEIRPTSGTVLVGRYSSDTVRARYLPRLRRDIGHILQQNLLLRDRSVYENVAFVSYVTGAKSSEIKSRVLQLLEEVNLADKSNDKPGELSAGERQRLAVARALANDPLMLLGDEPAGNLDPPGAEDLMDLFKRINAKGIGVLIATHNYELVKRTPARIVQLRDGKLLEVELR
jgi:cell division transport system ATP-binding protein